MNLVEVESNHSISWRSLTIYAQQKTTMSYGGSCFRSYLNQFQSRDPFTGYAKIPQSQNGYSYADNNPVNYIDPAGLARIKIWASAFIEPASITFPDPLMLDPFAEWHGDGRSFYAGGAQPSARVWHEVIIDTSASSLYYCDGAANYTFPFNYIKSNRADTGTTIVVSYPPGIMGVRRTGKAPAPSKATISVSTGMVTVHMEAHAANPLTPPGTPKIDYAYDLSFDLKTGEVTVKGEHDVFPWHELYVTIDNIRPTDIQVQDAPSGLSKTPGDLGFSPAPIEPRHAVVPALLN